jgi:hypothetical protein
MMSHPTWTLLVALLVAIATALPGDRPTRERPGAAAYTFLSCTVVVFSGSWLMYWIHG